mmetsp:Transcript_11729/g.32487  ORF Transcript_11729/g.32487 Transcript_11729/m.32487 type:complete len:114 (-) Transcript_11729:1236-1577(-)
MKMKWCIGRASRPFLPLFGFGCPTNSWKIINEMTTTGIAPSLLRDQLGTLACYLYRFDLKFNRPFSYYYCSQLSTVVCAVHTDAVAMGAGLGSSREDHCCNSGARLRLTNAFV